MIPILLGLLLALLPLLEGGASPAGLFATQTLIVAVALATLASARAGRAGTAGRLPAQALGGAAFVGALIVSAAGTDYLFGSFLPLWNVLMAALLALTLLRMGGPAPVGGRALPAIVAGSGTLQAARVLLLPPPANMTPSGSFANANQLSAYLLIALLVSVGLTLDLWREPGGSRRAAIGPAAAVLLTLGALLAVGSRGALSAGVAAGLCWTFLGVPRDRIRLRRGLAAGIALVALIGVASVAARFERVGDPYRFDRVRIWQAGLTAVADHPVLGMGPGMFERRGFRYNFPLDRETFRYSKSLRTAHSAYLQVLVDAGILGLAALMLFLAPLVGRLWRMLRREASAPGLSAGVAAGILACLLHGLVDTPFSTPAITLTLIILLAPRLPAGPARRRPVPGPFATRGSDGRLRAPVAAAGAVALGLGWLVGVALPYAAHRDFVDSVAARQEDDALARLSRAIRLNSYNPLYRAERAGRIAPRGEALTPERLAEADLDLREAHRLDRGDPDHLLERARLHARACFELTATPAESGRVVSLYRRAHAMGRKDPRPHVELASFLLALGRRDEGLGELEVALELEPRYLGARFLLARALLEAGRRDEAAAALSSLTTLRGDLASYDPKNGYERDLMRLDDAAVSDLRGRLEGS